MKTLKVIARSEFHPSISQAFRLPAKVGFYVRRYNGCLCQCGYPVHHTIWVCPFGWVVNVSFLDHSRVEIYLSCVRSDYE